MKPTAKRMLSLIRTLDPPQVQPDAFPAADGVRVNHWVEHPRVTVHRHKSLPSLLVLLTERVERGALRSGDGRRCQRRCTVIVLISVALNIRPYTPNLMGKVCSPALARLNNVVTNVRERARKERPVVVPLGPHTKYARFLVI